MNEDVLVRHPGVLSELYFCLNLPFLQLIIYLCPKAIWDYAEAFATLFRSGLLGRLDPKLHQVVLCGHSAGSIAVYGNVYSSISDRAFD